MSPHWSTWATVPDNKLTVVQPLSPQVGTPAQPVPSIHPAPCFRRLPGLRNASRSVLCDVSHHAMLLKARVAVRAPTKEQDGDHPLSAVRDCIFAATSHTGWQRTHSTLGSRLVRSTLLFGVEDRVQCVHRNVGKCDVAKVRTGRETKPVMDWHSGNWAETIFTCYMDCRTIFTCYMNCRTIFTCYTNCRTIFTRYTNCRTCTSFPQIAASFFPVPSVCASYLHSFPPSFLSLLYKQCTKTSVVKQFLDSGRSLKFIDLARNTQRWQQQFFVSQITLRIPSDTTLLIIQTLHVSIKLIVIVCLFYTKI